MKEFILLLAFVFSNFCFVFAQNNKTNVSDTIPYHFYWKRDWTFKTMPLQLFDMEVRIYSEKKITKHLSIEVLGSYFIPKNSSVTYAFLVLNNGSSGKTQTIFTDYRYGYKGGFALKRYDKKNAFDQGYWELNMFYKYFHTSGPVRFSNQYTPLNNSASFFYQIFCIQALYGRRIEINKFVLEYFGGISLRARLTKSSIVNYDENSHNISIINKNWIQGNAWTDANAKNLIMPLIQLGIKVGLKIK